MSRTARKTFGWLLAAIVILGLATFRVAPDGFGAAAVTAAFVGVGLLATVIAVGLGEKLHRTWDLKSDGKSEAPSATVSDTRESGARPAPPE
jgi:hypothetical protein